MFFRERLVVGGVGWWAEGAVDFVLVGVRHELGLTRFDGAQASRKVD